MAAKKKPAIEEPESSRTAGIVVLLALITLVTAAVFALSPTAGPLFVWGTGAATLWWYVRHAANPAPPPPPERGSSEKPQFTVTHDEKGRSTVHWRTEVDET